MNANVLLVSTILLAIGLVLVGSLLFLFLFQSARLADQLTSVQEQLEESENHLAQLQSDYDDLFSFTFCGDDLIDLEMVYTTNERASSTLTEWVDEMWGDILDSWWQDFWYEDMPVLHVVETGYTNDYFVVYYENPDFFDSPDGVFIISHHCWLDVEQ